MGVSANAPYFEEIRIGGGFGSTGCDIDKAGNIQTDGALSAASINATPVGITTPAAGKFTTLQATGVLTAGSGNTVLTNATGTIKGAALESGIAGAGLGLSAGVLSHLTTEGFKHIPSAGATNQTLIYSAAGTAQWSDNLNLPGTLNVTGATSLAALTCATFHATGAATFDSTINSTGKITSSGGLEVTGSTFLYAGDVTVGKGDTANITRCLQLRIPQNDNCQAQIAFRTGTSGTTLEWMIYRSGNTDTLGVYSRTAGGVICSFIPTGVIIPLDLAVNGGDLTSTATTFNMLNSGVTTLNFGGAADVNIGNVAKTTTIAGLAKVVGNIGFYNTAPQSKQTVSGAKGSNAALGSLMTALAALGLVTDSTTT